MAIQSTQPEHPPRQVAPEPVSAGSVPSGQRHDQLDSDTAPACEADRETRSQAETVAEWPQSLDAFLRSVERRAFVMARYALNNDDDALDTVQDAMLKLCESYGERPCAEWGPLFYRILHNSITDRHRPRGMNRLKRWLGRSQPTELESDNVPADTMDTLPSEQPGPQDELQAVQRSSRISEALSLLSVQQREVFLLRRWQGLSVRETASAMNIGEGSVKTHLSRAIAALKESLQEQES